MDRTVGMEQQVVSSALRQAMSDSMLRCREWLIRRGIGSFEHELDRAAGMAVLEQSMRACVLDILGVEDIGVKVGQVEGEGLWYLSVFGVGIWYEQFDPSSLLTHQDPATGGDPVENRSA